MENGVILPDFVEELDVRFAGIVEEYFALKRLFLRLEVMGGAGNLERAVLLQCEIAWQYYHAILLLLANRFGVQALVLSRTLFELAVSTLYLIKNPLLLPDFLDYGKLKIYEQALVAGLSDRRIARIRSECEQIRSRFKGQNSWHGSTIKKMAKAVRLDFTYDRFYPDSCAAVHADATKTLVHGSRGWINDLRHFANDTESDFVRYISFQLIGQFLFQVNKALEMGHDQEANALMLLVLERAKFAAAVN